MEIHLAKVKILQKFQGGGFFLTHPACVCMWLLVVFVIVLVEPTNAVHNLL